MSATSRCLRAAALVALCLAIASPAAAQGMMNPKDVSGIPLPVADVPVGTVTVRVVRGTMANNLSGVTIELVVDGKARQMTTDATGRVQVNNLAAGTRLKATAIVDGTRIESQDITVGASGLRVLLAADDPNAAAVPTGGGTVAAPAPAPATVSGAVTFGPDTRVVAQFANEQLSIFYALQIVNSTQAPVDIGGPLTIELPRDARSASILEGSSKNATANGAHVIVTGPFAPGTTQVDIGFELPIVSSTVRLVQRWPAALDQVLVLLPREGGLDMSSPQAPNKRETQSNGVPVVIGMGPGLAAGETLSVEITGLPYHPRWPRYTALTLAGLILALGIGAAVRPARATAGA